MTEQAMPERADREFDPETPPETEGDEFQNGDEEDFSVAGMGGNKTSGTQTSHTGGSQSQDREADPDLEGTDEAEMDEMGTAPRYEGQSGS